LSRSERKRNLTQKSQTTSSGEARGWGGGGGDGYQIPAQTPGGSQEDIRFG